jgi:hypothetical protein
VKFTADDLQFQDDEETEFGSDGDYGMSYSSGNDRLEIADKINSATSYIPRGRSGSLVKGRFGQTVAEGKAMADNGEVYDSVQPAVDAASSFVRIGPGRFEEQVSINTAGLTVSGSGDNTIISQTGRNTIHVNAPDVTMTNFSVFNGIIDGLSHFAINANDSSADRCTIRDVTIRKSDSIAINPYDGSSMRNEWIMDSIRVVENGLPDTDSQAIFVSNRGIFTNSIIEFSGGIAVDNNNGSIVVGNHILSGTRGGIYANQPDTVIGYNRIKNISDFGLLIRSADNVVFNNRVSNCQPNIQNESSSSVFDGNLPPAP